jgi:hypothetical protein
MTRSSCLRTAAERESAARPAGARPWRRSKRCRAHGVRARARRITRIPPSAPRHRASRIVARNRRATMREETRQIPRDLRKLSPRAGSKFVPCATSTGDGTTDAGCARSRRSLSAATLLREIDGVAAVSVPQRLPKQQRRRWSRRQRLSAADAVARRFQRHQFRKRLTAAGRSYGVSHPCATGLDRSVSNTDRKSGTAARDGAPPFDEGDGDEGAGNLAIRGGAGSCRRSRTTGSPAARSLRRAGGVGAGAGGRGSGGESHPRSRRIKRMDLLVRSKSPPAFYPVARGARVGKVAQLLPPRRPVAAPPVLKRA